MSARKRYPKQGEVWGDGAYPEFNIMIVGHDPVNTLFFFFDDGSGEKLTNDMFDKGGRFDDYHFIMTIQEALTNDWYD